MAQTRVSLKSVFMIKTQLCTTDNIGGGERKVYWHCVDLHRQNFFFYPV